MLCPITDRTQHYGVPLLRASLQQNGASAEQWLLPLFNARTGYLFFTVFSKATSLAVTAVPGGEYQFWIAKIGIHQSKFFCRQLLAYGAAQSSLHSQLYLSRLAKRQTAGYADHTCAKCASLRTFRAVGQIPCKSDRFSRENPSASFS